jgi:hypothetical protein
MAEIQQANQPQQIGNYAYPSQMNEAEKAVASLVRLLYGITDVLTSLRREFRGEALYQDDSGQHWVQVTKPLFVKFDFKTNTPVKITTKTPWGEEKEVYIANDEAIEEILSNLKFAGVNQITAVAGIDQNNYLDDLKEFECKLAATLALKQKEWGCDKELLPLLQFKIKTIVQDARSLALDGRTLKAIQTTVQRVEQLIEDKNKKTGLSAIGSAF